MIFQKEDLALTLSLSFSEKRTPSLPQKLTPFLPLPSTSQFHPLPNNSLFHDQICLPTNPSGTLLSLSFFLDPNTGARTFLKGIDVNRSPATEDADDEAGVSSPNSTVSSISGKRSEKEANGEDHEIERGSSRGMSDDEDGETSRKKLRLSKDQSAILEDSFKEHNTLNPKQKLALAKRLGLRPRQVEVWFQNRRARTKLKQTEVDCEFLRRCCENLTEENRRLQKEVQELRALKLTPQLYMQMAPPTTLTMCPSCECVAVLPPSCSSSSSSPQQPTLSVDPRSSNPLGPTAHSRPIPFHRWATSVHARPPL